MKHKMKKVLFAEVLFAATAALAATKTTWTGNGADNKWSNAANWSAGVPDASVEQPAEIGLGDYEIEIDGEQQFYSINLVGSSTANAGTLTLTGAGRLYTEDSGSTRKLTIGAGRRLVLDGPSFSVWNYEQRGEVLVKSGTFKAPGKDMKLDNGATFVVDGGTFDASGEIVSITNGAAFVVRGGTSLFKKFNLNGEGEFRVLDGTVSFKDMSVVSFAANAIFQHTGGTISTPDVVSGAGRLWKEQMNKNATLETRNVDAAAAYFKMATTNFYEMAGTLVATNGGVWFAFQKEGYKPMTFSGRGAIVANKLTHNAQKSNARLTFDLSSLTLGAGGILGFDNAHYDNLDFQNGITFGAYGDWSQADNEGTTTHLILSGPVTFNTRDAFDGVTSHTMSLKNVDLSDATALKVVGGGTVNLNVETGAERLRALTVSDASTLSFQTNKSHLCVDTATIGSGATLTLAPDKRGYLDVAGSASLAAGSVKLEFADLAFATSRCPIYYAPEGVDPDLSAFDTTDVPAGLTLAKRENVVYLTDGSEDANDTTGAASKNNYWTGAASDDFATAGNWEPAEEVGTGLSGIRHFNGWKNMTVKSASASLRPKKIIVDAECGPFRMTGKGVRLSDKDNSIATYSAYPAVFDLPIGKDNGNGTTIQTMSYGIGYLALTKGADLTTKNANTNMMTFVGDVRLGGSWRYRTLAVSIPSGETVARPHRLTLLPGATLTLDGGGTAEETLPSAAAYDVTAGATLVVQNASSFKLDSAKSYQVDGAWTVNCPFLPTAKQTFCGSGTVTLPQVGAENVTLAGLEFRESVTLVPGDWDVAIPLFFRDTPTVKTKAETTLGDEVSFEIEPHATVSFDTTDGDLTLNSPITGGADIVKTGTGRLVLNCAGNVIDMLTVSAGAVEPGPALVAEADAGFVPFLTVKKLVGDLTFKLAKVRATVNADGTTTYSFKNIHGLMLIVR